MQSCLLMISNEEAIKSTSMKASSRTMVKTVTQDASSKLMLVILKIYRRDTLP